ncbi:MAG: GIY-YIG nuclease family protein [Bacillota bacterium]
MRHVDLTGWNYIVYVLIKNNFENRKFSLNELYEYEKYFAQVYPKNMHIKDKLRQTLQNLRDKGFIDFVSRGRYQMIFDYEEVEDSLKQEDLIYLLSNPSIPEWVKIGRTNSIERRLKQLYNTSVPLPFEVVETIKTETRESSEILEKSIHNIIDTLNPDLRKNTEANKREFFKMSPEEGKQIFELVSNIIGIQPNRQASIAFHNRVG